MRLYFDLETLPDASEGAKERVKATLKAPANYTKPETIAKWVEENAEEAWKKTSFDGGYGSICVIGYAIDDSDPTSIIAHDEKAALTEFWKQITAINYGPEHSPIEWVGHNLLGFDLPFLWKRVVVHSLGWHRHVPKDAKHGFGKAFCTMQAWAGYRDRISLDALAKVLGLASHKDAFDGSMVHGAWMAKEYENVAAYCRQDVELTRTIYKRLI